MEQEAGMAWSKKRKTFQSVNIANVHELDDMSSDKDSSNPLSAASINPI
jgi:hypothetical protein